MKPAAVVVAVIAIGISASGLMSQAQSVGNRSDEDMIRNVIVPRVIATEAAIGHFAVRGGVELD